MIHVTHRKFERQFVFEGVKNPQKNHGINSAGNSDAKIPPAFKHIVILNGVFYFIDEFVHKNKKDPFAKAKESPSCSKSYPPMNYYRFLTCILQAKSGNYYRLTAVNLSPL